MKTLVSIQGNSLSRYSVSERQTEQLQRQWLKQEGQYDDDKKTRGIRTKISRFSSRSARTLADFLARCKYGKGVIFMTLTHTSRESRSPIQAKDAIDRFGKNITYRYPSFSALWRLERQKNGEPHFHLIVWGLEGIDLTEFFRYAKKSWKKAMQLESTPMIDIKPISGSVGACLYLCGHSVKVNQTWPGEEIGRYWGKINAKAIPMFDLVEAEIDEDFLRRLWLKKETRRIKWLEARYKRKYEIRPWETGDLKLFRRSPYAIWVRYSKRFLKKTVDRTTIM